MNVPAQNFWFIVPKSILNGPFKNILRIDHFRAYQSICISSNLSVYIFFFNIIVFIFIMHKSFNNIMMIMFGCNVFFFILLQFTAYICILSSFFSPYILDIVFFSLYVSLFEKREAVNRAEIRMRCYICFPECKASICSGAYWESHEGEDNMKKNIFFFVIFTYQLIKFFFFYFEPSHPYTFTLINWRINMLRIRFCVYTAISPQES